MAEARRPGARGRDPDGFGVWIDRFTFPFVGIHELPAWVGVPATIVWIVAMMNMVNFLDGLDGLAAGVCAIAGGDVRGDRALARQAERGHPLGDRLRATLGFLRHNFYPARIFMGDSGALLLGFVLATLAIQGLLKTAATVALFFPLFVLAIPIVDTSFVVARRLKYREKIYAPDQAHLHHRFLRRGFSQRRAVADHVRLVRDARRRRARDAVRPVPRGRRVAPLADAARGGDRPRRARLLDLRRLRCSRS